MYTLQVFAALLNSDMMSTGLPTACTSFPTVNKDCLSDLDEMFSPMCMLLVRIPLHQCSHSPCRCTPSGCHCRIRRSGYPTCCQLRSCSTSPSSSSARTCTAASWWLSCGTAKMPIGFSSGASSPCQSNCPSLTLFLLTLPQGSDRAARLGVELRRAAQGSAEQARGDRAGHAQAIQVLVGELQPSCPYGSTVVSCLGLAHS